MVVIMGEGGRKNRSMFYTCVRRGAQNISSYKAHTAARMRYKMRTVVVGMDYANYHLSYTYMDVWIYVYEHE